MGAVHSRFVLPGWAGQAEEEPCAGLRRSKSYLALGEKWPPSALGTSTLHVTPKGWLS